MSLIEATLGFLEPESNHFVFQMRLTFFKSHFHSQGHRVLQLPPKRSPAGWRLARVLCSEWNEVLALAGASPWLQLSWVAASPLATLVRLCHRLSPAGPPLPPRAARARLVATFEAGPQWLARIRTRRSESAVPRTVSGGYCTACGQGPVNRRLPHAARELPWLQVRVRWPRIQG